MLLSNSEQIHAILFAWEKQKELPCLLQFALSFVIEITKKMICSFRREQNIMIEHKAEENLNVTVKN